MDPRNPAYQAALDMFIAEVEKLMREKLTGIGDYKNLADIEAEIERTSLRIELLQSDPEFAEIVKKLDARRQEVTRKRDQMKPFLLKLERELAVYKNAKGGAPAPQPAIEASAFAPAPPPVAAAPQPQWQQPAAAPAPQWQQPARPAAAAPPRPAPAPPAPSPQPSFTAPAASFIEDVQEAVGDVLEAGPELDMSLPPEEPMDGSIVAAPTDFITGPGVTDGSADGELLLDTPAPPAAPSPAQQWPPPGQPMADPFAAFQAPAPAAKPAAPAAPRPAAPAASPRPAAAPAAPAARPAAPAAPGAKPAGTKPPWVK